MRVQEFSFCFEWFTPPRKSENQKTTRSSSNYHMPRYSERAARITTLDGWMTGYLDHKTQSRASHHSFGMRMSRLDLDPDVPSSTTFAGCVIQQLRDLKSNRYLSRPWRRPEAPSFAPSWIHDDSLLTKREFGVLFRMTKESFDELLSLIDDHPVFSTTHPVHRNLPNTSFKSRCIITVVEPQAHECEQQFNLPL